MVKHWLHVVKTSEYKPGLGAIGLSERWKDTLSKVGEGDRIVTYLANRSAFVDLKEVSKGYYFSEDERTDHEGPHRIKVKRIYGKFTSIRPSKKYQEKTLIRFVQNLLKKGN